MRAPHHCARRATTLMVPRPTSAMCSAHRVQCVHTPAHSFTQPATCFGMSTQACACHPPFAPICAHSHLAPALARHPCTPVPAHSPALPPVCARAPSAPRSPTRVSLFVATRSFTPTCHTPPTLALAPPHPRPCTRPQPVRAPSHPFAIAVSACECSTRSCPHPTLTMPLLWREHARTHMHMHACARSFAHPRTRRLTHDGYHTIPVAVGAGKSQVWVSTLPVQL